MALHNNNKASLDGVMQELERFNQQLDAERVAAAEEQQRTQALLQVSEYTYILECIRVCVLYMWLAHLCV